VVAVGAVGGWLGDPLAVGGQYQLAQHDSSLRPSSGEFGRY
jgi:hypothetical protein